MQFPGFGKQPLGIVYNTTMSRPDAALALALLYGFEGKREARLAAVSVSGAGLGAAAFCDAVGRIYNGSGPFVSSNRVLPIGLAADGELPADSPVVQTVLERRNDKGEPAFARGVRRVTDTAEPRALIRNSVTAQQDGNAAMILSAPATELARTLDLYGTPELIAAKVRALVVVDACPTADIAAMRKLLEAWPTPVVLCGREVGDELPYPGASIEKDFGWAPAHPVVDFYRAWRAMPYDAPSWDMAAALYAARPDGGMFQLSAAGTVVVDDRGNLQFSEGAGGKHRRLVVEASKQQQIIQTYIEMATAKPVPRVPFRRRAQAEQKKAQ